ncbi:MAG: ammonium transporter [Lewinellaceae bacterium]|nr:ammonium transporter [Lewinellaceae bacterium]
MNRKFLIPFVALAIISVLLIFVPDTATSQEALAAINGADTAWMLMAAGLVLLMTPGLSFFYGGMVNFRNVVSTMLQSFISLGVVSVLWVAVGFSLAFGDSFGGIIGNPMTFGLFHGVGLAPDAALSPTIPLLLFALFQLKFAIITPALITGSFAERIKFNGYLLFIVLFTLFIYTPLAHWTWHPEGFLRRLGVLDFAGGTVVHMSAGFAALAAAVFLGKRHKPHSAPANIPYVVLGTGLLWFGWFGFNAGSALSASPLAVKAFATTNFASAAAMLSWVFYDGVMGRKITALGACIGAVVGLVAITPAAGFVTIGESVFIGFAAAIISNITVHFFNRKGAIDDTLDVFPCHGVGGITGMVLTGVFAEGVGLVHGSAHTFLLHLLALVIVGVFTFGGSYLLLMATNALVPLRVRAEEEEAGLDVSQHGEKMTSLDERIAEYLELRGTPMASTNRKRFRRTADQPRFAYSCISSNATL